MLEAEPVQDVYHEPGKLSRAIASCPLKNNNIQSYKDHCSVSWRFSLTSKGWLRLSSL